MFIFTRRLNQAINIGGDISVKVVAIRAGQVRLGVNAAREVHIVRGELRPEGVRVLKLPRARDGGC